MKGEDWMIGLGEQILRALKIEGEVILIHENVGLTRYANSRIHQNLSTSKIHIGLRAREGKKAAVVWGGDPSKDGILNLVSKALSYLRVVGEGEIPPLLKPTSVPNVEAYDEETVLLPPSYRAEAVKSIVDRVSPFTAFGVYATVGFEYAFLNSLGHNHYFRSSHALLSVNLVSDEKSSWEQASSKSYREIDPVAVAESAKEKMSFQEKVFEVEPGEYTAILSELAVATLLSYLGHVAFSAKSYLEGRSFLKDNLGKKVFDERIDLIDDPLDPGFFPLPFDFEGYPKRRHVLVEKGVAVDLVYDRKTASKLGKESSGHASTPFSLYPYPFPSHIKMNPGSLSLSELIESTERGIFVNRLHYVNIVEPLSITITGMTRDGTFLIEEGEIKGGLKNLRFTVGVRELFNSIEEIGSGARMVTSIDWYDYFVPSATLVPPIKFKKFKFTGTTEH